MLRLFPNEELGSCSCFVLLAQTDEIDYNRIMVKHFLVTTSFRPTAAQTEEAERLAQWFEVPYAERRKRSLAGLIGERAGALVVYKAELIFVHRDGSQLAFHPDTAMLRIKNGRDPLLELLGQAPKRILDTTMGMANDSLVMAFAGHQVTALEASPLIHLIVSRGLSAYLSDFEPLNPVMRSIETCCTDSLAYMRKQVDKAFDVVYCDPMFKKQLDSSPDFAGLRGLADFSVLTAEMLSEAKRIARESVIIKAYFKDPVFETFGFERQQRLNAKFHYGRLCLNKGEVTE